MQIQAVLHAFSRSNHDAGGCIQGAVLAPELANAVIWVRIFGGKLDFKKIGKGAGNIWVQGDGGHVAMHVAV